MARLEKIEFVEMPDVLVIGKTIKVDWAHIRDHNPIPEFWEKCLADGTFKRLEQCGEQVYDPSYVGYMTMHSYTCGMLMKKGCTIPGEGFDTHEIMPTKVAVGWIKGPETEAIMNAHRLTERGLEDWGYRYNPDCEWSMELYNCPRFTQKDENDMVILDYYIPVVK